MKMKWARAGAAEDVCTQVIICIDLELLLSHEGEREYRLRGRWREVLGELKGHWS